MGKVLNKGCWCLCPAGVTLFCLSLQPRAQGEPCSPWSGGFWANWSWPLVLPASHDRPCNRKSSVPSRAQGTSEYSFSASKQNLVGVTRALWLVTVHSQSRFGLEK